MRPTRGVLAALLAALVLHQLSRITGGGWLSLGSGAALALPVAAVLLRPRLDALAVLSTPVRTRVGHAVDAQLTVRNTGTRPSAAAQLVDTTPGLSCLVVAVPALAPGAQVQAVVRRTATARGFSRTGSAELVSTAPFGLIRARRAVEVDGPFAVAPAATTAPVLQAGGDGSGAMSQPVAGTGTEVLGLRPFRPGDAAAAVHPRATARHGRPVVLERERETGPGIVLLCVGRGSGQQWEQAVATACALAEQAAVSGRFPRLLANGVPAPARPAPADVLEWHARLDHADPLDAATTAQAARAAARGGLLVVLAPPGAHEAVAQVGRSCAAAGARVIVLGS